MSTASGDGEWLARECLVCVRSVCPCARCSLPDAVHLEVRESASLRSWPALCCQLALLQVLQMTIAICTRSAPA